MMNYIVIFFISLFTILLELMLTRMLNLKAWNHVVYVIIPFAILGYGIGANFQMIFKERIGRLKNNTVLGIAVLFLAFVSMAATLAMIRLPIRIDYMLNIFKSANAIGMLLLAYTLVMLPFVIIGFIIVYIFYTEPKNSHRLYFVDLIGAGLGAVLFFPLINNFQVIHSIAILAFVSFCIGSVLLFSNLKRLGCLLAGLVVFICFFNAPEPRRYAVDQAKGWEWIPGYFPSQTFDHVVSRWHPLGRTDVFRIKNRDTQAEIIGRSPGAFLINLDPPPEFSYFSTNFLAGTPAYKLSEEGLKENNSKLKLFSQSMEVPYLLLNKPKVLVIGTGGGRDIFMARSHGATEVLGAEINPGIVKEMSPGGKLYDYTGRIYTRDGTKVHAIDGRHLVKSVKDKSFNLIILNGVDTFSGLSSGAYAYAESFLYTQEAVEDYLRILDDDGVIMFVRWLFHPPRETLRLFAVGLEALKQSGAKNPLEHIIIGDQGWSVVLFKKTPFTDEQRANVIRYLHEKKVWMAFPLDEELRRANSTLIAFELYGRAFTENKVPQFEYSYPFDITLVTDDKPFFYKYYKFSFKALLNSFAVHHTGTVIFLTQALIFLQALIFIILFIVLPLCFLKKSNIQNMPGKIKPPFIVYFSCLGLGFMFIEIPIMQKFVLLLGSPIYSITVILAVLLIATGCGSLSLPLLNRWVNKKEFKVFFEKNSINVRTIFVATVILLLYLVLLIVAGERLFDRFMSLNFPLRILLTSFLIFPLGFLLGVYFPSGLEMIDKKYTDSVAWAWALNSGFSVLGSITAIILAQFLGFNSILQMACVIYLIAYLSLSNWTKNTPQE